MTPTGGTRTGGLVRRARSVPARRLAGVALATSVVLLVALPLLSAAVVDLDGAWLLGLLAAAVLATQLLLLTGLAAVVSSVARLHEATTRTSAQLGAEVSTAVEGAQQTERTLTALSEAHAQLVEAQRKRHLTIHRTIGNEARATTRQVQALLQLLELVRPERALPPLGGWAVSPDLALHVVQHLLDHRPSVVVECGSGSSTLLMALTVRRHGLPTRVISLDHEPHYAEATRRLLAEHGVEGIAEVRTAPLAEPPLEGHTTPWYDVAALADLPLVDLLLVDGPPNPTGPDARYPAVPLLRDRFAAGATVLLDDYVRPEERAVVQRWLDELPGSTLTTLELHKGLAVISLPFDAPEPDLAAELQTSSS